MLVETFYDELRGVCRDINAHSAAYLSQALDDMLAVSEQLQPVLGRSLDTAVDLHVRDSRNYRCLYIAHTPFPLIQLQQVQHKEALSATASLATQLETLVKHSVGQVQGSIELLDRLKQDLKSDRWRSGWLSLWSGLWTFTSGE